MRGDKRGYDRTRYMRLLEQGRCGQCKVKLPKGVNLRTCQECRDRLKEYRRNMKNRVPRDYTPIGQILAARSLERCPHCSLLLPHASCVGGSALDRRVWE